MITSLAYFGVYSPNYKEWETFGPEILGCELAAPGPDGAVRLRLDELGYRIAVHPAEHDDVAYFGWSTNGAEGAQNIAEKVEKEGIKVVKASQAECEARGVLGYYWFKDPSGFRHELAWGMLRPRKKFHPGRPISGFRTGDQGLGHVVLGVPDLEASDRFYRDVMGFQLSDTVVEGPIYAHFYHVNGRHHSLAIARPPISKPCFLHLMVEVETLEDVGTGLDVCEDRRVPITRTLGAHTNDRMTSFYMHTPSDFRIEYGCGGLEVDDLWEPRYYDRTSLWGHRHQHKELSPFLYLRNTESESEEHVHSNS